MLLALLAGFLLLSAAALIILLLRNRGTASLLLKQELGHLRESQEANVRQIFDQLGRLTTEIGSRLSDNLKHVQEANRTVGDRLDNAAKVVGEVQNRLGKLDAATQQVITFGQEMSKFQEALRAPKFRGGVGEFLLEDLLSQILPREFYDLQHRFQSGEAVDAVIRTREGLIPVDAKFPLPNFNKLIEAKGEEEKKIARKDFIRDVRKHVEAIVKYIRPEEGTLPFVLMYIPAENVYYEVIIRDEETDGNFLAFAQQKRVFPVSPNSFHAYLQTIAIGLRGMRIEEWARTIDDNLQQLKGDFVRCWEDFLQMGTHLKNLRLKYETTEKRLDRFQEDLVKIEVPAEKERLKVLPGAQ